MEPAGQRNDTIALSRNALAGLVNAIKLDGYAVFGPTVRDGAIVYDHLDSLEDLPIGVTDKLAPGHYRLAPREDQALFGHHVGPHSLRREFLIPVATLFRARRTPQGFAQIEEPPPARKLALFAVRPCDLAAVAIQDRVLLNDAYRDTDYAARRHGVIVIAANCTQAGGTCFCASMDTGPEARAGFDLALTELDDDTIVCTIGSDLGRALVQRVEHVPASDQLLERARLLLNDAATHMGRTMDPHGLRDLLATTLEHPRWDDIASRCLGCANCTLSCPTCFCTSMEDMTSLDGTEASRLRRWDSCFTVAFSYVHGGAVRPSLKARYRQWLTHKLGSWHDQFGSSGCVGCGRCITWCPVGIDLTEEITALRQPGGS
ncbi:MAG: 4Fe-4S dicluster domain-containing protein [Myxococcales bacterium]